MNAIVDIYNGRRKDKAFANEVLDEIAEQLTQLLEDLGNDKASFEALGINFEEKAFYDILKTTAEKYGFDYPEENLIVLSKKIKEIVDDKAKYVAWSQRVDIKAEMKVSIVLVLAEYKYPLSLIHI